MLPLTPKVEIELIGNDGLIITFRVKGTTQFQKVLDAYAARKELPASDLRLMYAGNNVDTKSTINDVSPFSTVYFTYADSKPSSGSLMVLVSMSLWKTPFREFPWRSQK